MQNEQDFLDKDLDYQDKISMVMQMGHKYLMEKYGTEPSDEQLEGFKDDYMKNLEENQLYEDEVYDFDSAPKGDEVIDQGAGYGELADFEDGDGFDYSEQEQEY